MSDQTTTVAASVIEQIDVTKLRDWNPILETELDKAKAHLISGATQIIQVLANNNSPRLLRGIVAEDDAHNKTKLAAYLAANGYAKDKLMKIYNLTQAEMDANCQLVKGTTIR